MRARVRVLRGNGRTDLKKSKWNSAPVAVKGREGTVCAGTVTRVPGSRHNLIGCEFPLSIKQNTTEDRDRKKYSSIRPEQLPPLPGFFLVGRATLGCPVSLLPQSRRSPVWAAGIQVTIQTCIISRPVAGRPRQPESARRGASRAPGPSLKDNFRRLHAHASISPQRSRRPLGVPLRFGHRREAVETDRKAPSGEGLSISPPFLPEPLPEHRGDELPQQLSPGPEEAGGKLGAAWSASYPRCVCTCARSRLPRAGPGTGTAHGLVNPTAQLGGLRRWGRVGGECCHLAPPDALRVWARPPLPRTPRSPWRTESQEMVALKVCSVGEKLTAHVHSSNGSYFLQPEVLNAERRGPCLKMGHPHSHLAVFELSISLRLLVYENPSLGTKQKAEASCHSPPRGPPFPESSCHLLPALLKGATE
ncbi:uncharacterized protein LOC124986458 [Sciurus carolinensis]|uniref:uncharacterized protein LOC124986458 n=1 Tax=Sciurus carolinensis TaxID=30640 RepID=UPI001FB39ADC|nr:uncharacterized protein LOC124986458 [Sciurus carolinensis]